MEVGVGRPSSRVGEETDSALEDIPGTGREETTTEIAAVDSTPRTSRHSNRCHSELVPPPHFGTPRHQITSVLVTVVIIQKMIYDKMGIYMPGCTIPQDYFVLPDAFLAARNNGPSG